MDVPLGLMSAGTSERTPALRESLETRAKSTFETTDRQSKQHAGIRIKNREAIARGE